MKCLLKKNTTFSWQIWEVRKNFLISFFGPFFHENYPQIGFGQPVKDACITCEELNLKVKSPFLNDNAKRAAVAELMVHKRRAKKFYSALKEVTNRCVTKPTETAGLSIDFMANVSLPCIPVQDTFYLRQLTVNVFGIHNLATRKSTIFIYHEGEGGKGANEVCTMINWYIENKINSEAKTLYLVGDNCAGQNKNNTMIRMVMQLCETKKFNEVKLLFPVRGHSFMPNDRDFGIIRRKLRKEERFFTIEEVVDLIKNSSKNQDKFSIVKMTTEDFVDYSSWWPKFYKKTCLSDDSYGKNVPKNQKRSFMLSKYREISVSADNPHSVLCNMNITGLTTDTFRLRNSVTPLEPPTKKAYSSVLPLNIKKMEDIRKTLVYIPEEKMTFWNSIISWPTSTAALEEDESLND